MKILSYFIPGLVAILGNYIFYLLIKNRVDRQIENYKISYSGIFKEKIEIHKKLLKMIFNLKKDIQTYQYFGDENLFEKIKNDFSDLIEHYSINKPFLRDEIYGKLKVMTSELQECFEAFSMYKTTRNNSGLTKEQLNDITKKYIASGNKLKLNDPFKEIEEKIIDEMKSDLKIES